MAPNSTKELVWDFLKAHPNKCAREIALALKINRTQCQAVLRTMLKIELVTHVSGKGTSNSPRRFKVRKENEHLVRKVAVKKRTKRFSKSASQKLWNNIKIEQMFSVKSITASIDVSPQTAERFIKRLEKAGYVTRVINQHRKAKHRYSYRYRLERDTGRIAPMSRTNGMWDQNEGVFYPFVRSRRLGRKETSYGVAS